MDNKYCSTKFKCGEDLDAALDAALCIANGELQAKEAVLYTEQTLTDEQKVQARENIGAISSAADDDVAAMLDEVLG